MRVFPRAAICSSLLIIVPQTSAPAQEVRAANARTWELSALIQIQHLHNRDIAGNAERTNNGFRMRRGRLRAKGRLSEYVETAFQMEIRDNQPRLKDAEGRISFPNHFYVRAGQFKVPVWREELRSASHLFLIERSAAAEFLLEHELTARQIGVEIGRQPQTGLQFALSLSNGSGEGVREDAGRQKEGEWVNNGKLYSGRVNLVVGRTLQLGLSGAVNRLGNTIGTANNVGTVSAVVPDLGLYLPAGNRNQIDVEAGAALGRLSRHLLGTSRDREFLLAEVSARFLNKWRHAWTGWGGLEACEFSAGVSYVEGDRSLSEDEILYLRMGPALYFGKSTRLQLNGEWIMPRAEGAATTFELRTQASFVF